MTNPSSQQPTTSAKLPLTAVVITHRSDERFGACLESLRFAQEVLIVDNNSENDWEAVAQKFTVKVISHPEKIDDFSAIRNSAAKKAAHDWVLFIDSDEVVDSLEPEILMQLMESPQNCGSLVRSDTFLGHKLHYGEVGKTKLVRFFHKEYAGFSRPVHEVVLPSAQVVDTQIHVTHYSHTSLSEFVATIDRYAQLEAKYRRTTTPNAGTTRILFELLVFPPAKFCYTYLLQLGFLDGWRGFIYAVMMSLHSIFVRIHWYEYSTQA